MTNFKEVQEAITFANEHIVSGGFFNSIKLNALPLHNHGLPALNNSVKINEHLFEWATSATNRRIPNRLFYLFGDFGSGKSGVCHTLLKQMCEEYETSRYADTTAEPFLPIYFDLNMLTGIYDSYEFANKRLAELIEVMFRLPGIPPIDGDDIIKLVRQYPCLIIFDGFDEAVQKLNKGQQTGFLNKLLAILPAPQYSRDLMRIGGKTVDESTLPDTHSRIIISCRSQLFESKQEQIAFTEAFYTTQLSLNGMRNYQAYQIEPINKDLAKRMLTHYFRDVDLTDEDTKCLFNDLVDLSDNPLLLSFTKSLLPDVTNALDSFGYVNSAQIFSELFTKLLQKDSGKSVINIKEKQKILGSLALTMWQQGTKSMSLEVIQTFFFNNYKSYLQLQTSIDTGRIDMETAFQDLHSSMIKRDERDMYSFYNPLMFDYFLAVGIFNTVFKSSQNSLADEISKNNINTDTLIFMSHMLVICIMKRDMHSHSRFYDNWLAICTHITKHSDMTTKLKEQVIEMWEVVTGEDAPNQLDADTLNDKKVHYRKSRFHD